MATNDQQADGLTGGCNQHKPPSGDPRETTGAILTMTRWNSKALRVTINFGVAMGEEIQP